VVEVVHFQERNLKLRNAYYSIVIFSDSLQCNIAASAVLKCSSLAPPYSCN